MIDKLNKILEIIEKNHLDFYFEHSKDYSLAIARFQCYKGNRKMFMWRFRGVVPSFADRQTRKDARNDEKRSLCPRGGGHARLVV